MWFGLAAMQAWLLGGCGSESATRTELIGSAGGMVEHEGVALEIPAGALDEEISISISTSMTSSSDRARSSISLEREQFAERRTSSRPSSAVAVTGNASAAHSAASGRNAREERTDVMGRSCREPGSRAMGHRS